MKYSIDHIYSTKNNLEITVNQTGAKASVKEKREENFKIIQGFRVIASGETIGYGSYNQSEKDLLLYVIKIERYAHLAYKEAYYDLLRRLAAVGFILKNEDEMDERL